MMHFSDFSAVQVRIARPTDRFDEIVAFYEKGLGLKSLAVFPATTGIMASCSACRMSNTTLNSPHISKEALVRHRLKTICSFLYS